MRCEDCGFEYAKGTVCPRCGYDAAVDLVACISCENPQVANKLEADVVALAARVKAGEVPQSKLDEYWQFLDKKAQEGDLDARHLIGRALLMQQKYDVAHKILTQLADLGHTFAQLDLGKAYEEGLGVQKNDYESIKFYRKAAVRGNPLALFMLARRYTENGGVLRQNIAFANNLMIRLADAYPNMVQRKPSCGCGGTQGPSAEEFAMKTATQMSRIIKFLLMTGVIALVAYFVYSEYFAK